MDRWWSGIAGVVLAAMAFGGCLLVRTTEHRIRLNEDGSGEALMRLVDIRSDAGTDSLVSADLDEMMRILRDSTGGGFVTETRRITAQQVFLAGDTLVGELAYIFRGYGDLEGVRVSDDEIAVIVPPEKAVVKTNGKVEDRSEGGVRIVWERDATRLMYEISERVVPPSTSLAPLYRARMR
jgi:hypothetical protein